MFRSLVATLNALGALRYMVKSRGGGWVLDLDSKGERALRRGWADTGMDPGEFSVSIDPGHGRKSFYKSMIKLFRTLKKYLFLTLVDPYGGFRLSNFENSFEHCASHSFDHAVRHLPL